MGDQRGQQGQSHLNDSDELNSRRRARGCSKQSALCKDITEGRKKRAPDPRKQVAREAAGQLSSSCP